MTGTSRALRRLGVAGLSAVLMTTGMAAFAATAANAANVNSQATGVDLQPPTDNATVNTCNPFTATVTPAPGAGNNYTVTVTISEPAHDATEVPASTAIGFCSVNAFVPSAGANSSAAPADATPGSGAGGGTFAAGPANAAGPSCTGTSTIKTSPGILTCTAVYTTGGDGVTANNGTVTFGVTSNTAGSMNVNAGVDVNQNGGVDTFEPQDTSTKTWVANTPGTANSNISCTPTSATAPAGTSHVTRCQVTTSAGTGVTGLGNVKLLVQSGPDSPNTITCAEDLSGTTGTAAGQYGFYNCTINNAAAPGLSKTGTDSATAWVDLNNNNVIDTGEPAQAGITTQWVAPAPAGSTVALTCTPNPTTAAGDVCQDDPTSDKTATFTATVTNNSTVPATPAGSVIVNFTVAQSAGAVDAGDTETLSASSCTTASNGQCSVVFTDTVPTDGEGFTVTASVPLAAGGPATDTAVKNFHTPTVGEARNITVTPATAKQTSGGAQALKATVTDRFRNPVKGVFIDWSETGPGGLRSSTFCTTDATGSCSEDVTSLSSEKGNETVTATIDATGASSECSSPAGFSNYTAGSGAGPGTANNSGISPNTGGQNNAAPGTTAGNCSASSVVTWAAASPPPPTRRVSVSVHLTCFSRHAHKVTCVAQLSKAIAGVTVIFRDGHGNRVGSDVTGSGGKARLHLHGLRRHSHHKYQAHAKRSSRTFAADSNFARVTVK